MLLACGVQPAPAGSIETTATDVPISTAAPLPQSLPEVVTANSPPVTPTPRSVPKVAPTGAPSGLATAQPTVASVPTPATRPAPASTQAYFPAPIATPNLVSTLVPPPSAPRTPTPAVRPETTPTVPPTPTQTPVPPWDVFGITMLYPTKPGTSTWNSSHWNNGVPRTLDREPDPYDPTGWSHMRGTGDLTVDGEGGLTMGGRQPRIYLGFGERKFWQNVEVTVYFQRISDDDKRSSGLIIATRAGYLGHTSDAPCTATTYFGRMRNDGDMDFMKELKHSGGGRREVKPIWQGGVGVQR